MEYSIWISIYKNDEWNIAQKFMKCKNKNKSVDKIYHNIIRSSDDFACVRENEYKIKGE